MDKEITHEDICLRTWGCVPIETDWAKSTKIYQEMKRKMIQEKNNLTKEK